MKSSRKKKRKPIPVPVASMGDIAFLLIIFFLVCSESIKDKSVPMELPTSEHVIQPKITVVAYVSIDETGQIYFDSTPMDSPKDIEWGVRALLTNTVSDEQRHVQFKCDKTQPKETFQPVLKAIAEGGGIIEAVGEIEK